MSSCLTGKTLRHRYTPQPVNAVCCETHTEHTDTLCGQDTEFWYVKAGGTYSFFFSGVGLTSPGTAATSGLLYSPR
jgi:hypothetical protein